MADADVSKVPASSGLTGSAALNATITTAKKSTASKTATAPSKASVLLAKSPQTKSPIAKPTSPKANSKTSLTNPPIQKSLTTSKPNLEIKQNSSPITDSKKIEQPKSTSSSLSSLTSKSASSSDSKSSNLLASGKLNKSATSLDTLKISVAASAELKPLSKSSDSNKVSSSSSVEDKSKTLSPMETTVAIIKDSKSSQKVTGTKKTQKSKSTNLQETKTVSKSETNMITSTVSDDKLENVLSVPSDGSVLIEEKGIEEKKILASASNQAIDNSNDIVAQLSTTESDGSNESFELINIAEAKVVEEKSLIAPAESVVEKREPVAFDAAKQSPVGESNLPSPQPNPNMKDEKLERNVVVDPEGLKTVDSGNLGQEKIEIVLSSDDKPTIAEKKMQLTETKSHIDKELNQIEEKCIAKKAESVPNESKPNTASTTTIESLKTDFSSPSINVSSCSVSPKGPENSMAGDAPKPSPVTAPSTNSQPPNQSSNPEEATKHSLRLQVWNNLDKKRLVNFPRPCKGRIPHFVGSPEAAQKLAALDLFKNAKSIQVNPDKPQSHVRLLALQQGKQLLVPDPNKTTGFLMKAEAPENASENDLMFHVTQQGIKKIGKTIDLKDGTTVDLVVLGAVAVSKEGHVIGRGKGYADLEFALMMSQGIVTQDTVVACTVHDEQVFDTLPKHLFKSHDVPVDLIVTPTQVIHVEKKLEKPTGIIWNRISNRRLQRIPVLTKIRDEEVKENKDCTLKEVDSDPEEESTVRPYFRKYNRYPFKGRRSFGRGRGRGRGGRGRDRVDLQRVGGGGGGSVGGGQRDNNRSPNEEPAEMTTVSSGPSHPQKNNNRRGRTFNGKNRSNDRSNSRPNQRQRGARRNDDSIEQKAGGDANRTQFQPRGGPRYSRKPPMPIEFIMKVSGLTRDMRVRDLKAALSERQVKPYDITWVANDGQAYLLFAKDLKHSKPNIISELAPVSVVEGFPAKLELKVEGPPRRHKLDWTVNGKSIDINGGRIKMASKSDGTVRLLIDKVTPEDSGEYAVAVKNRWGEVTSKASVVVTGKKKSDSPDSAPKYVNELQDVTLDERACLTLSAEISGNPIPEVEWSKDGVVLSPNDRMQFSCDGSKVSLELNLCRVIDGGVYKCKLTNQSGSVESSAKVTISRPKKRFPILPEAAITSNTLEVINNMIEKMRDLKIKSEGEESAQSLSVELATPVSRIESIEVSAV